jgi:hypothetical protein
MKILVQLNRKLRICYDDRQWILQARRGQPTEKSTGWRSLKFFTTRDGLAKSLKNILRHRYDVSLALWMEGLPDLLPLQTPEEWSVSFTRPSGTQIDPEDLTEPADVFVPLSRARRAV